MPTSPVANSLINKCSALQGEVSILLSDLKQKNVEITALKTSLKVLGYGDLLHLVKTRKKHSKKSLLPHGALSRLCGEYIRLKTDKDSTFTVRDIVAYIKDTQSIKTTNAQLNTNITNCLKKQESSGIIVNTGRIDSIGKPILWKKC